MATNKYNIYDNYNLQCLLLRYFFYQLFYSSTAYQTDFRNGTKYICRMQYDDYHVTLNTFFSQNMKNYIFRETMKW